MIFIFYKKYLINNENSNETNTNADKNIF